MIMMTKIVYINAVIVYMVPVDTGVRKSELLSGFCCHSLNRRIMMVINSFDQSDTTISNLEVEIGS